MCRSGARAQSVKSEFDSRGIRSKVYAGGIMAWKHGGNATSRHQKSRVSVMRQVQIAVGFMIVASAVFTWTADPKFNAITMVLGVGLLMAGITNTCVLGSVLNKMPWNRR